MSVDILPRFVIGAAVARGAGAEGPAVSRVGLVASMFPNPLASLVVARAMSRRGDGDGEGGGDGAEEGGDPPLDAEDLEKAVAHAEASASKAEKAAENAHKHSEGSAGAVRDAKAAAEKALGAQQAAEASAAKAEEAAKLAVGGRTGSKRSGSKSS